MALLLLQEVCHAEASYVAKRQFARSLYVIAEMERPRSGHAALPRLPAATSRSRAAGNTRMEDSTIGPGCQEVGQLTAGITARIRLSMFAFGGRCLNSSQDSTF
jgi:hypothetical protein